MTVKHCPTCLCQPRQEATARRENQLDALTDWLNAHGGWANRRTLLRNAALGVRNARELDALIDAYQTAHPGSVTLERTGERGQKAVVVTAATTRGGAR